MLYKNKLKKENNCITNNKKKSKKKSYRKKGAKRNGWRSGQQDFSKYWAHDSDFLWICAKYAIWTSEQSEQNQQQYFIMYVQSEKR